MSDRNDDYGRGSQGRRIDVRDERDYRERSDYPRDDADYRDANRSHPANQSSYPHRGERQDQSPFYGGQRDYNRDANERARYNEYGNYRGNDYPSPERSSQGSQLGSDRDWQPRNPAYLNERNNWSRDVSGHDGPFGTGSQGYGTGYRSGENSRYGSSYTGFPGSESSSYMGGAGSYNQPRGQHTGKGPKGYQRSDERIREDVCDRLTRHGEIDASEVDIKVSNGEVTLTGSVYERNAKRMCEDVAESVDGVREVHNQLRVGEGSHSQQANTTMGTSASMGNKETAVKSR